MTSPKIDGGDIPRYQPSLRARPRPQAVPGRPAGRLCRLSARGGHEGALTAAGDVHVGGLDAGAALDDDDHALAATGELVPHGAPADPRAEHEEVRLEVGPHEAVASKTRASEELVGATLGVERGPLVELARRSYGT